MSNRVGKEIEWVWVEQKINSHDNKQRANNGREHNFKMQVLSRVSPFGVSVVVYSSKS